METCRRSTTRTPSSSACSTSGLRATITRATPGVGDCTVTIPPPNVTGVLHMGHAMDDTIQDAIIRYEPHARRFHALGAGHRPCGHRHADQGGQEACRDGRLSPRDRTREVPRGVLGLDATSTAGIIVEQIKRMGCSIDFSDEHFTMDADYARAVRKVFCDWYHDGPDLSRASAS